MTLEQRLDLRRRIEKIIGTREFERDRATSPAERSNNLVKTANTRLLI